MITKGDESFPQHGNDRELQLVCGAVLSELCRGDGELAAVTALALSAATMGGRQPQLPFDLGARADDTLTRLGESRRQRPEMVAARAAKTARLEFEKVAPAIKAQDVPSVIAGVQLLTQTSSTAVAGLSKELFAAVEGVRKFMLVQDEELQMLWWLLGDRSWDLNCAFSKVPREQRPLILGKELATLTSVLPGPLAVGALLSRAALKDSDELSIVTAVNACEDEWLRELVDGVAPSALTSPIHCAITKRLETGKGAAWVPGWAATTNLDGDAKQSSLQLAVRFYRECILTLLSGMPT
jgi:hypothetical protein